MLWESAITKVGSTLLAQWTAGHKLTIDCARAGTGSSPVESLKQLTQLLNEQQVLPIVGVKKVKDGTQLHVQFSTNSTEYTANQVGIWAHLDDGPSILMAVYQNERGIDIPSDTDIPDFSYEFYAIVGISNDGELEVIIDPNTLISFRALEERLSRLTASDVGALPADGTATAADKFSAARKISLTGDVTGEVTFDGSKDAPIETKLSKTGVRSGQYGPSGDTALNFGGQFWVPWIDVDENGRITSVARRVLILPAKPTATDVGALPNTGGTVTGPITAMYAGENNPFIRAAAEDRSVQLNVSSAGNIGIWGSVPGKSGWLVYMDKDSNIYIPGQANSAKTLTEKLPINLGGTNANNAADARKNLGAFGYVRHLTSADTIRSLDIGIYTYSSDNLPKDAPCNDNTIVEVMGTGDTMAYKATAMSGDVYTMHKISVLASGVPDILTSGWRKMVGIWKVGDRVTSIHSFPVTGLITSSKTSISLNLNLGKSFSRDITKINIYSLSGGLRSVSGAYIDGTSDTTNLLEDYDVKMFFGTWDGQVSIQISKASGFDNVLNNSPVALLVTGLDIEFSR